MSDTLDKLLSWGSTSDWISPLSGIIQDFTNGPYNRFYIDRYAGWSVNAIKRLLKSYGIKPWGDLIAEDMIIFTVKQTQAGWTQYILEQKGIPILGVSGQPIKKIRQNNFHSKPIKKNSKSDLDSFLDKLGEWLGIF